MRVGFIRDPADLTEKMPVPDDCRMLPTTEISP